MSSSKRTIEMSAVATIYHRNSYGKKVYNKKTSFTNANLFLRWARDITLSCIAIAAISQWFLIEQGYAILAANIVLNILEQGRVEKSPLFNANGRLRKPIEKEQAENFQE